MAHYSLLIETDQTAQISSFMPGTKKSVNKCLLNEWSSKIRKWSTLKTVLCKHYHHNKVICYLFGCWNWEIQIKDAVKFRLGRGQKLMTTELFYRPGFSWLALKKIWEVLQALCSTSEKSCHTKERGKNYKELQGDRKPSNKGWEAKL